MRKLLKLSFLAMTMVLMTMASVSHGYAGMTSMVVDFGEGDWDKPLGTYGEPPGDKGVSVFIIPGHSAKGLSKLSEERQAELGRRRGKVVEISLREKGFSQITTLPVLEIGSKVVVLFPATTTTLSLSELVSIATQAAREADRAKEEADRAEEEANRAQREANRAELAAAQAKEGADRAESAVVQAKQKAEEPGIVVCPLKLGKVNIKVKGGTLCVHDSLIPQNRFPLILTYDENNWGLNSWKGDYFWKRGDWWYVKISRLFRGARFNAKRGEEWIDPNRAVPGKEVTIWRNPDGSLCFIRTN